MASKLNWLKNYPAHVLSERNGCPGKLDRMGQQTEHAWKRQQLLAVGSSVECFGWQTS